MKKTLFIAFLLTSISSFSQFKITGYFDAEIGVSYAFSDKLQTELRINDDLGKEFNSSISLQCKIVAKEDYNLNVGLGISLYPFSDNIDTLESFFFPLNIEVTPFKEVRNFGLVLETAYHVSDINANSGIRNSVGIRYIFN